MGYITLSEALTNGLNKIGSGDDYSLFDSTGHLTFHGLARPWKDELGDVTRLRVQGTGITENYTEGSMDFLVCSNLSDYLYANLQLNHDKDLSVSLYPHIHWWQEENHTPNWLIQYRWRPNGSAKVTSWTSIAINTNAFAYIAGTLNQISYGSFVVPPLASDVSDIFQIRLLRDNTNASGKFLSTNTYTTTAGITSFDVHMMVNSIGSTNQYEK